MRKESLPSPGPLSMGIVLHTAVAKAISAIELSAMTGAGGKAPYAKKLDDFFVAARTAISTFIDAVVPTRVSMIVTNDRPDVIRIRTSKDLDRGFVPLASAFTIAGTAKVVADVAIDGPDILVRVTVPFAVGNAFTVAYVLPGATNARDLSGNVLAAWAATAGTNSLT